MVNLKTKDMEECQTNGIDKIWKKEKASLIQSNTDLPDLDPDLTGSNDDKYDVHEALKDLTKRKISRQQFASQVVSYIIAGTVFILILVYTLHLVEMCRTNAYLRMPD